MSDCAHQHFVLNHSHCVIFWFILKLFLTSTVNNSRCRWHSYIGKHPEYLSLSVTAHCVAQVILEGAPWMRGGISKYLQQSPVALDSTSVGFVLAYMADKMFKSWCMQHLEIKLIVA